MKSLVTLSLLMFAVWISSALVLIVINEIVMHHVGSSLYRSVLGAIVFAAWLGALYISLKTLALKIVSAYVSRRAFMLQKAGEPSKA